MKNSVFIDELFYMSSINPGAGKMLFDELYKIGRKVVFSLLANYGIRNVTIDDLEDTILDTIFYITNSYIHEKSSFHEYVYFVFNKRLNGKITDLVNSQNKKILSLDAFLDDGTPLIESIPDTKEESIPAIISIEEAHLMISSPKNNSNALEKRKFRIRKLLSYGFSGKEITKKLGITFGQFRYAKTLIDKEGKENKMKLVLK